jgi:hypothetical protein
MKYFFACLLTGCCLFYFPFANAQKSDCAKDQATVKQTTSQLNAVHKRITKYEADLAVKNEDIKTVQEYIAGLQKAKMAVDEGSTVAKMLDKQMSDAGKTQATYNQQKKDITRLLSNGRTEEKRLTDQLNLVRSRVEKNCGAKTTITSPFKLTVQVMDATTNRPVTRASVSVKNNSGAAFSPSNTKSTTGEFEFIINKPALNTSLRVIASATDYEEKWSDVTSDLLQSNERLFTVYLNRKKAVVSANEIKYGPYHVDLTGWVPTGLRLKKGAGIRVETSGKITYVENHSKTVEMTPDGHGYWNFFVLRAKIGKDIMSVGSSGNAYAKEDGMLELGAPRVSGFFPQDAAGKSGSWAVYVYAKDATEEKTNTSKQPLENKIDKEKKDLGFLKAILQGEQIPNKSPEQIAQEVRTVILTNNLRAVDTETGREWLAQHVKIYYENFNQPSLSVDQMGWYKYYLRNLVTELQTRIDKK